MRSRDGNSTFSLRLCTIILFFSLALNAGEYLISYRYVVKDATLYNDLLLISHAMKPCRGKPQKSLVLENNNSKDLKQIISQNPDIFTDYIHKLSLDIKNTQITSNMQNTSTTIITLKTTCFKVDFNENFVRITPLK